MIDTHRYTEKGGYRYCSISPFLDSMKSENDWCIQKKVGYSPEHPTQNQNLNYEKIS